MAIRGRTSAPSTTMPGRPGRRAGSASRRRTSSATPRVMRARPIACHGGVRGRPRRPGAVRRRPGSRPARAGGGGWSPGGSAASSARSAATVGGVLVAGAPAAPRRAAPRRSAARGSARSRCMLRDGARERADRVGSGAVEQQGQAAPRLQLLLDEVVAARVALALERVEDGQRRRRVVGEPQLELGLDEPVEHLEDDRAASAGSACGPWRAPRGLGRGRRGRS